MLSEDNGKFSIERSLENYKKVSDSDIDQQLRISYHNYIHNLKNNMISRVINLKQKGKKRKAAPRARRRRAEGAPLELLYSYILSLLPLVVLLINHAIATGTISALCFPLKKGGVLDREERRGPNHSNLTYKKFAPARSTPK